MDPIWIFLGVAGWAVGLIFLLVLLSGVRSSYRDRKRRDPFSDATVTRFKDPPGAGR
jgi:hypothetical protein